MNIIAIYKLKPRCNIFQTHVSVISLRLFNSVLYVLPSSCAAYPVPSALIQLITPATSAEIPRCVALLPSPYFLSRRYQSSLHPLVFTHPHGTHTHTHKMCNDTVLLYVIHFQRGSMKIKMYSTKRDASFIAI
jgi:hypothetical protein